MNRIVYMLAIILAALAAPAAMAVEVVLEYQIQTTDCDGQPVSPANLTAMEFYIDDQPIPAADVECPPPGQTGETPPAVDNVVDADPSLTSVTLDLPAGRTYHIRARVSDATGWSNLSAEHVETIPAAPLRVPVIIRMTF